MSAASHNHDQKNTKLQIKQPTLEKHNTRNISRAILNTLDNYRAMFEVDVFEGKRLLYSYGSKTGIDQYNIYSFGTNICIKTSYIRCFYYVLISNPC